MTLKDGDFVEITYTAKFEDGSVFDTTDEAVAKKNDMHNPKQSYGSVIICIGKHQVIAGLDHALVGKDANDSFSVDLDPQNAFGKKDAKLIQLVPLSTFKKQNIEPRPGLQLEIDGSFAKILRVSGGRIMVDFNHPYAGRKVSYDVGIKRQVTDLAEQASAFLNMHLGRNDIKAEVNDGKATISFPKQLQEKVTDPMKNIIAEGVKDAIPTLQEVSFSNGTLQSSKKEHSKDTTKEK